MKKTLAFCLSIALSALLSSSIPATATELGDPVPGHSGVTYEMLLKRVVPDLTKDKDGTWKSSNVPHLRGTDGKTDSETDLAFKNIETLTVKEAGRQRLLVLTGDSQTDSDFMSILAVFDNTTRVPRLLDYMDVGGDRFTGFSSPSTLAISDDSNAFVIDNNHFNSNQNYSDETVLYLAAGKLQVALSQFTLNQGMCGYEMRQVPSFAVHDEKGAKYRAIVVRVTQTTTLTDETCDEGTHLPKAGKHTYTDIYRWSATRNGFETHTNAMSHLMLPDE
jgi:hypothetical protein